MTGGALPFPVEESIPGFHVADYGALGGRRIPRAQPDGKCIELVNRQVECGHASTRRSFADEGAQLLCGTAAYATIPCQTWAAVRAARVAPVAAGALFRIRLFRGRRILARQERETQAKGRDHDSFVHACFASI